MKNTPQKFIQDKVTDTLRAAIENEAKWIYYLTTEGIERGLDVRFAKNAMTELGEYYADTLFEHGSALHSIAETLMNRAMVQGYEAQLEMQSDADFTISIGYCPMLNMWDKLCDAPAQKESLCAVACSLYAGLAERLGMEFSKPCAIACGAEQCKLCFRKV